MSDAAGIAPPDTAKAVDRRQFIFGGTLLAASAAALALRPRRAVAPPAPGELDRAVPLRIGAFRYATASGLVVPPKDEISERIYDQVLTRVYVDDRDNEIMLLIAYGSAQDEGLQLHRPEVCYPAAGYSLSGLEKVPVALRGHSAVATFVTAERTGRREQVFYWTRIGTAFPASLWAGRAVTFRTNLGGRLPDGVLVRISTVSESREGALRQIEAFNAALLESLSPQGLRLLLGPIRA